MNASHVNFITWRSRCWCIVCHPIAFHSHRTRAIDLHIPSKVHRITCAACVIAHIAAASISFVRRGNRLPFVLTSCRCIDLADETRADDENDFRFTAYHSIWTRVDGSPKRPPSLSLSGQFAFVIFLSSPHSLNYFRVNYAFDRASRVLQMIKKCLTSPV